MRQFLRVARWLLLASGLAVVSGILIHLVLRPNPDTANSEQYAVLSAYIAPNLTGESHDLGSSKGLLVISERTTFSLQLVNPNKLKQYLFLVLQTGHAKASMGQLRRPLVFEFWATNVRDVSLRRNFHLPGRYEIATPQEMQLYPSEAFLARFPSSYGALTFSRVAFNRHLTEAFFYTEHLCGLCGEGKFVFMQKIGGRWVVADTASTWIS